MRAVFAEDGRGGIDLKTVPVPQPAKGQVVVRMAASPVNPSDLALIDNLSWGPHAYPLPAGREGSGTVVASGGGLLANRLLGKRVAVVGYGGSWADFNLAQATQCLPLPDGLTFEQGAVAVVNPVTAVVLLDMAKAGRHRAVVNTAAAGQLGRMIHRLFTKHGMPVIHIVRRQEQADLLKDLGARDVLVSTAPQFDQQLKEKTGELKATLFFDAIGGAMTGRLMAAAPDASTILIYGFLSGENINLHPGRLISDRIRIEGFFLGTWFRHTSLLKALRQSSEALKLIPAELRSEVARKFLLVEAVSAIEHARLHATEGKALLVIDPDSVNLSL